MSVLHAHERGGESTLATQNAGSKKKPAKDYGYCSVCQKTVLMSDGRVPVHQLPDGTTCLGSEGERFTGPQYKCSVCGAVKPVRDGDGRIMYHKARGERCDGSGSSPVGGRTSGRMNARGLWTVAGGGLPSLGKPR
jgi:hypothetical protein